VLAGSSLNLPADTISLAPVLPPHQSRAVLPVYFPRFWGTVTADRQTRKLTFAITKVFDGPPVTLRHVVTLPVSVGTSDRRTFDIPPFAVRPGCELDLGRYWDEIMAGNYQAPVLPDDARRR